MTSIQLGTTADMHVHLRDGPMMHLVTPTIREGGVSVAYVMPNLVPPITTIKQVKEYCDQLEAISPQTTFLMSFYLSHDLTPDLIREAASKGYVQGVKCYPAGVTTNSKYGVDPNNFSAFYPIFEAMQEHNLVLNLHGEKPKGEDDEIHVLNAEPKFLPALRKLVADFPRLKIVLEHCTTKDAVDTIRDINKDNKGEVFVAATITAHHLSLTIDSWAGNPVNFCKPVAKLPVDRNALVDAATSGEPWFFFGSDSAPHPIEAKSTHVGVCAGVYTQSHAISYVADVFDKMGKLNNLKGFVGEHGLRFYGVDEEGVRKKEDKQVWLVKRENTVPEVIGRDKIKVVPFKAGEVLGWSVEWRNQSS